MEDALVFNFVKPVNNLLLTAFSFTCILVIERGGKMRRRMLLLLLAVFLLAGCAAQSGQQGASQAATSKTTVATRETKAQAAKKLAGDADERITKRLDVLKNYTEDQIPGVKFPTFSPFSANAGLNAAVKGDVGDYTLYLSTSTQELTPAGAPLALRKVTPTSRAEADSAYAALGYQAPNTSLDQTALTASVKATVVRDGKATAVIWNQGRYSITVRSTAHDLAAAKALARKTEALIGQNPLPKTETHGAIVLTVESAATRVNTVSWRETSAYYKISGQKPLPVLKLAIAVS